MIRYVKLLIYSLFLIALPLGVSGMNVSCDTFKTPLINIQDEPFLDAIKQGILARDLSGLNPFINASIDFEIVTDGELATYESTPDQAISALHSLIDALPPSTVQVYKKDNSKSVVDSTVYMLKFTPIGGTDFVDVTFYLEMGSVYRIHME